MYPVQRRHILTVICCELYTVPSVNVQHIGSVHLSDVRRRLLEFGRLFKLHGVRCGNGHFNAWYQLRLVHTVCFWCCVHRGLVLVYRMHRWYLSIERKHMFHLSRRSVVDHICHELHAVPRWQ